MTTKRLTLPLNEPQLDLKEAGVRVASICGLEDGVRIRTGSREQLGGVIDFGPLCGQLLVMSGNNETGIKSSPLRQ